MINIKEIEEKFEKNHLSDFLKGFAFVNSKEAIDIFISFSSKDFFVDYENITKREANFLLYLQSLSENLIKLIKERPDSDRILPTEIVKGLFAINDKISPWKNFLMDCIKDPNFNAEYWIMKNGVMNQNRKMRGHISRKLF